MSLATNLAVMAGQLLLSNRLAAAATALEINGLEADTLYEGQFMAVPAVDAGFGWQSRFTSGGAWDTGASDYAVQIDQGSASSAAASASTAAYGAMGTQDGGSTTLIAVVRFTLYTGAAGRQPSVIAQAGYNTTDGTNRVVADLYSRRAANGAIADFRFIATAADAFAAGTRGFLRKLG